MTASLARLLRQSISNEDELVSIGQEIEVCPRLSDYPENAL